MVGAARPDMRAREGDGSQISAAALRRRCRCRAEVRAAPQGRRTSKEMKGPDAPGGTQGRRHTGGGS